MGYEGGSGWAMRVGVSGLPLRTCAVSTISLSAW